jgi:hypothetical protein
MLLAPAATGLAVLVLTGCALDSPTATRTTAADSHAEAVSRRIQRWQLDSHLPMDFARLALETQISGGRIEILEARGDAWNDDGVLLVRITAEDITGHYEAKTATVTRCYRYAVTKHGDAKPDLVDPCPDLPAMAIPERPPPPMLPSPSWDRAKAALAALAPEQRTNMAAVRKAVEGAITGSRGANVRTATDGSALGVAVRAGDDCLLARVDGDRVNVWSPPPSYLEPGEAGCDPALAARGDTPDPH